MIIVFLRNNFDYVFFLVANSNIRDCETNYNSKLKMYLRQKNSEGTLG